MAEIPSALSVSTAADVLSLPFVTLADRKSLPVGPGLYFAVIDRLSVAYIGMSAQSLRGRWLEHERRATLVSMGDLTIAYIAWERSSLLWDAERAAIQALTPVLNSQHLPSRHLGLSLDVESGETLLTADGAAKYIGVSHTMIHRYVRSGLLPVRFFGRERVIFRSELERLRDPSQRPQPGRPRKSAD